MIYRIYLGEARLAADHVANRLREQFPEVSFTITEHGTRIQALGKDLKIMALEMSAECYMDEFFDGLAAESRQPE